MNQVGESVGDTYGRPYQLMNEDFPAEWFPISMMVIFFLGASSFSPRVSAIDIRPCSGSAYNVWHSWRGNQGQKAGQMLVNSTLRILSFRVVVAASRVLAELVDPRDFTFPDILDKDLQV